MGRLFNDPAEVGNIDARNSAGLGSVREKAHPVIFLLNSLGIGGSEAKTVRLVNRLARDGWPVHLLYLDRREALLGQVDSRVPVHCLERRGPLSLRALRRLLRYAEQHGAGTILAMNLYPSLYASLAAEHAPAGRIRNLVAVNTTDHVSLKRQAQMMLYRHILRRADGVVFGCQTQMSQWIRQYGLAAERCGVIYNGVDVTHFAPSARVERARFREAAGFTAGDLIVGTVGQLRREKSQGDLIEAIVRLRAHAPNVAGLMVGNGPQRAVLEQRIAEAGAQGRIVLAGQLDDVRPALEAMDVFVLPSVAVETFSNAALEAMAMGKPVVLSDIGGAREMVTDGVTGRIFAKGDVSALTDILLELAHDPARRSALAENARRQTHERFSYAAMVDAYKSLLSPPGPRGSPNRPPVAAAATRAEH